MTQRHIPDLLTNCLTLWNTFHLEKLTVLLPVNKFAAFYGIKNFITMFTKAPSLVPILSQINPVHAALYVLKSHFLIILPSMRGSSEYLFHSGLPTQISVHLSSSPIRNTFPVHHIHFDLITRKSTGLFISPSGISELDCATTKTDTAERNISIGRESLQVFFVLGALAFHR